MFSLALNKVSAQLHRVTQYTLHRLVGSEAAGASPISQIAKRSLVTKVMHQVNNIRKSSRVLTSTFWTLLCVVRILKQEEAEICCEKGRILGSNPKVVPGRPPTQTITSAGSSPQTNILQQALAVTNEPGNTGYLLVFYITIHTHSTKCCR